MSKKTDNKNHKSPSPSPSPKKKSPLSAGLIYIGVFIVFCFALLVGCYGDYMHKIESLSIFLPVSSFLGTCLALPGGLLTWVGSLLTLSMHTPALGAAVYAVLLSVVIFVTVRAFSIPKDWMSVALLPSALILLSFVSFGYLIYTIRPLGYAFSLPVGVIIALLLYWGVRAMRQWWLRTIAILAIVALGYPYLGFYALFAALLCCIDCLRPYIVAPRMLRLLPAAVGIIAVVLLPRMWFAFRSGDLMQSQIYISGLPRFFARETWMWALYACVFISLVTAAIYRVLPAYMRWHKSPRFLSACVCMAAVVMVWVGRYSDRNFMLGLRLDRLIWDNDYSGAVQTAKDTGFKMTRANTVLSYVALIRSGEMGTSMFDIPYGYEPYNTTRDARSIFDVCGALVSYHLGMPNYAYRWGMEYTLEQGITVERLKIMAKCAILNGEPALARKFLDILYNVPTHRDWARKYLGYLDNPLQRASDLEMREIMPLMCHHNEFINDQGNFEDYVWKLLARAGEGSPQFNELSMQASLVAMDLDTFIRRLPAYAAANPRIPLVYQQAALLWSLLAKQPCPIEIDSAVRAKHDEFLAAFRRLSAMEAEEQRQQMAPFFENTYWYYFIFMADKHF